MTSRAASERVRDIEKSTRRALEYMKDGHGVLELLEKFQRANVSARRSLAVYEAQLVAVRDAQLAEYALEAAMPS